MYICATASTPLAAALLLAGVSPGAVLVFLLAGPATNAGTLALLRRELGNRVLAAYLAGISLASVAAGVATDALVGAFQVDVQAQLAPLGGPDAGPLAWASALLLALLALAPLARGLRLHAGPAAP
jgi:hypothetical protein